MLIAFCHFPSGWIGVMYYFSYCFNKIHNKGNFKKGPWFQTTVRHGLEVMAVGAWGIWSHCTHSDEAERHECQCSAHFILYYAVDDQRPQVHSGHLRNSLIGKFSCGNLDPVRWTISFHITQINLLPLNCFVVKTVDFTILKTGSVFKWTDFLDSLSRISH